MVTTTINKHDDTDNHKIDNGELTKKKRNKLTDSEFHRCPSEFRNPWSLSARATSSGFLFFNSCWACSSIPSILKGC